MNATQTAKLLPQLRQSATRLIELCFSIQPEVPALEIFAYAPITVDKCVKTFHPVH